MCFKVSITCTGRIFVAHSNQLFILKTVMTKRPGHTMKHVSSENYAVKHTTHGSL